ncbi:MAG: hypothetical protein V1701_02525 [Planctomycetota bacterium]
MPNTMLMLLFHRIKGQVVRDKGFPLGRTNLYFDCPELLAQSNGSLQYAHSFCQDGYTICVNGRIEALNPAQIAGILWHEFGKLISGAQENDKKADDTIRRYFKVRIKFDNASRLWYV